MTMVKKDIERRDAIFEASEYLAEKLAYFTIIDSECRYKKCDGDQPLEDALVGVYTAILEYAAKVRQTHDESVVARIGFTLIPLTEQPLQKLRNSVDSKATTAEKWADVADRLYLKKRAAEILARIDSDTEKLLRIHSTVLSAEDSRSLEWLSPFRYSEVQNNAQTHRAEGTGDWIKEEYLLVVWRCSTVIDDISRICRDDPRNRCVYWYFQFNYRESQSVQNMLRCILRQLHSKPLDKPIKEMCEEHHDKGSQPSTKTLTEALHSIITNYQGNVFLILDALDECPESLDHQERRLLLDLIRDCQERHSEKLHILVTSRPEPDIIKRLQEYTTLDLEENLESDIEAFVKLEVASIDKKIADEAVKQRIIDELLQIEKRRFRWADLQIKRLKACRTRPEIAKALNTIPKTLHDLYISVSEGIVSSDRKFARSILIWLSFCARPLKLDEVAAAVGLPVPEHVITICTSSFVTVRRSDNQVALAHFSVKEFLVTEATTDHWYQFSSLDGQRALAEETLKILLQQTEGLSRGDMEKNLSLNYVALNWHRHFEASTSSNPDLSLQTMVGELFCHSTIYRNWRCLSTGFEELYVRPAPICVASKLGLLHTVNKLLKEETGRNRFDLELTKAVYNAAEEGHLDVLDLLLKNVSVSCLMAERTIRMVQSHSLKSKTLEDIIETLSDSGALYVETRDQDVRIDERIVAAAASNEHCGLELMTILLDWFKGRGAAFVPVTERVLISTLENWVCGSDILQLLLDSRSADARIYPNIKKVFAYVSPRTLVLLLEARYREISFDEKIFAKFAGHASSKDMELILRRVGDDTWVTERVLEAAAQNFHGAGVMRQLLQRQHRAQVSEHVLCVAASQDSSHAVEILAVLLDECGPDFPMSEQVMLAVVGNKVHEVEMLHMLLRRQQAGFTVSRAVLYKAADRLGGREILEILMNNGGLGVPISEDMVLCAVHEDEKINYLLDLEEGAQIQPLPITDEILSRAVRDLSTATLQRVFRGRNIRVTDDMFVEGCIHLPTLSLLLQQPHDQLPIERMMQTLAAVFYPTLDEVINFLLDEELIEIDERVLERFAGHPDIFELLLQRKPHVSITEETFIRAAASPRAAALNTFFENRIGDLPIQTEELMLSIIESCDTQNLQRILEHFGPAVPITERVLMAATGNFQALQLLLQLKRPLPLSESLVAHATNKDLSALSWLLQERGSAVPLTERVLVVAMAKNLEGTQHVLRERAIDIDLQQIWKAIWKLDFNFWDLRYAFDQYTSSVRRKAARNILQYTRDVDVSEEMFEQASTAHMDREASAFVDLILICIVYNLPAPMTEQMKRLVLDRCDTDDIEYIRVRTRTINVQHGHAREFREMILSLFTEDQGTSSDDSES